MELKSIVFLGDGDVGVEMFSQASRVNFRTYGFSKHTRAHRTIVFKRETGQEQSRKMLLYGLLSAAAH